MARIEGSWHRPPRAKNTTKGMGEALKLKNPSSFILRASLLYSALSFLAPHGRDKHLCRQPMLAHFYFSTGSPFPSSPALHMAASMSCTTPRPSATPPH
jgi:hypothetical protein